MWHMCGFDSQFDNITYSIFRKTPIFVFDIYCRHKLARLQKAVEESRAMECGSLLISGHFVQISLRPLL